MQEPLLTGLEAPAGAQPVPEVMTQAQFAAHVGRTRQWCHKIAMPKLSPAALTDDGRIRVAQACRELALSIDDRQSRGAEPMPLEQLAASDGDGAAVAATSAAVLSYSSAKLRREQALAEIAELDLQARRGELVPAAEVATAGAEIAETWRQALANRRGDLVRKLRGVATADEMLRIVEIADRDLCGAVAAASLATLQELGA